MPHHDAGVTHEVESFNRDIAGDLRLPAGLGGIQGGLGGGVAFGGGGYQVFRVGVYAVGGEHFGPQAFQPAAGFSLGVEGFKLPFLLGLFPTVGLFFYLANVVVGDENGGGDDTQRHNNEGKKE